jgi:hypothetical protein
MHLYRRNSRIPDHLSPDTIQPDVFFFFFTAKELNNKRIKLLIVVKLLPRWRAAQYGFQQFRTITFVSHSNGDSSNP